MATRTLRGDARVNRARIVAAAQALYAEEGPDVSFNAVAQRAGVGNATLYRHFGSHEELREAAVAARSAEIAALLEELAAREDPEDELGRLLTWFLDTADLSLMGLPLGSRAGSPTVVAEHRRLRLLLEGLLGRAKRADVVDASIDRDTFGAVVTALIAVGREPAMSPRARADFLHIVMRGLRVR